MRFTVCVCVCVCVCVVAVTVPYIHHTSYLIIMVLVVTDHNDLFLQLSSIFEGKEFCVVNGSRAFSKDTMEKKIAEVCVYMLKLQLTHTALLRCVFQCPI